MARVSETPGAHFVPAAMGIEVDQVPSAQRWKLAPSPAHFQEPSEHVPPAAEPPVEPPAEPVPAAGAAVATWVGAAAAADEGA